MNISKHMVKYCPDALYMTPMFGSGYGSIYAPMCIG